VLVTGGDAESVDGIGAAGRFSFTMKPKNLFALPSVLPLGELTELLAKNKKCRIERIISTGQISRKDFWYDQNENEWVAVLQGEGVVAWEDGSQTELHAGDWLLIPAHKKHRVARTSTEPPCIWLAVFL
jgi:cupin 2 domain-containing protein